MKQDIYLIGSIKVGWWQRAVTRIRLKFWTFKRYIRRLLFPLYLFPIKLLTYSLYYLMRVFFRLLWSFILMIRDAIVFPFKSLKNFTKTIFLFGLVAYIAASLFVMVDYISKQYGWLDKFFCSISSDDLADKTVRIVGGAGEGSGFFIAPNQVLTNYHVIKDEPSPKIIFPKDFFITPTKIVGDEKADIAVLYTDKPYPYMVMTLPNTLELVDEEPLIASGYAFGTEMLGQATVKRGNYIAGRNPKDFALSFLQSDIELVEGMSGGPLTDICGQVVGINTMGVSGLSLFINAADAKYLIPFLTDQTISKIQVDPSKSPEAAVVAFYTYLKARQMEKGFALLSQEYLKKTDMVEWTNRFRDIIDVTVTGTTTEGQPPNTVWVKFYTRNWVDGDVQIHYYEGTWETVYEEGVYKMKRSNIKEISEPGWEWFY